MGLFTTKKPKKDAKVLDMEEDEDDDEETEDEDEEDEEEDEKPVKKAKKKKKVESEASEEELEVSGKEKAPELTSEQVMDIFNEIDVRLIRLEKHSILVGARD